MQFSVITISRDRPNSFFRHIISVLAQDIPEIEILIVDDSSEGDERQLDALRYLASLEMFKEIVSRHRSKIRVFKTRPREYIGGEGRAINSAIRRCKGDAIFVLCGDDLFPKNHFQCIIDHYMLMSLATGKDPVVGWPLNHLTRDVTADPDDRCILSFTGAGEPLLLDEANKRYVSLKEACYRTPDYFVRREDISADWLPGMNIFCNGPVDDRALYPRSFLEDIRGFPEWRASWWRDAMMRSVIQNRNYPVDLCWNTLSFHQWHPPFHHQYDQEGHDYWQNHLGAIVCNESERWGEEPLDEIDIFGEKE